MHKIIKICRNTLRIPCFSTLLVCINDLILLICLLDLVGYPMKACTDSFAGTNSRLLEEEVLKKVDMYESMLAQIAERCKEERVTFSSPLYNATQFIIS